MQSITETFKSPKLYPGSAEVSLQCQRLLADTPTQFDLTHRSHLLRIASTVLALEFKAGHKQRAGVASGDEHLVQVFEKLSTEDLLSLSVTELAGKFGCSRRHLNRLFHAHFGVSVAALRMEMRLLKAVSLLRDPDAKIINVADACGFHHLGLFNTCFRKRFGTSPGQWRKIVTVSGEPLEVLSNFGALTKDSFKTAHDLSMDLVRKKAMEDNGKPGAPASSTAQEGVGHSVAQEATIGVISTLKKAYVLKSPGTTAATPG